MYNLDEAAARINKEAGLTHTPFEVTPRMLCDWGRIYDGYSVSIQLAFRGNVLNSSKGEITIPHGNYFEVPPDLLFEFEMTDSVNITRLFGGADVLFIEPPLVATMDKLRIAAKDVTDFVTAFKAVLADSQKQQKMTQALRNYTATPAAKVGAVPVTTPAPAVKGIDKRKVQAAFQNIKWDYDHWGKNLATPPNWLKDCRVARGDKNTSALWNPADIALALLDKNIQIKKLDAVFVDLNDWADEWRKKTEHERE
jgi:hypothetical protein